MCRHHHIWVVCIACNFRRELQREFWNCKQATTDWFNTGHCKIEQTSTVIRDKECQRCELERWEQELIKSHGLRSIEDEEAEALLGSGDHWGRFSHIGESVEQLSGDNISLNF